MATECSGILSLVLSKMGIIPKKLHNSANLLNLNPLQIILIQKAVIHNTGHIVWKF